jgi:transcriptional regulator with XRE-family HTH domain
MKQPALGQKILELRKQKGFTQEELVAACNINVRTIQRIEAGEVSPRSFTVKAILEVLGFEYKAVFENTFTSGKFDAILRIDKNNISKAIHIAWILGIVYFVIGFLEIYTEYSRVVKSEAVFSNLVYSIVKIISIISFTFFIRGFVVVGNIYKSDLLQIVAFIILLATILFGIYDIFSLFFFEEIIEFSLYARIATFGVLIILLGVGFIQLYKKLGVLSLVTGILEILAGLFLILFLVEIGIAVIFPLQLLENILLFTISNKLSKRI